MSNISPWDDIKTPKDDLSVRQIKESKHLPLYWGKDSAGHCVFIVELEGDHAEIFNKHSISVHGIKTDLRLINTTGNQGLVVVLEKHIDQDLFFSLCETLVSALSDVSDSAVGLSVALSQIKRWKAFMAGKKGRVLSAEEIRGLFSELKFFQSMQNEGFSEKEVCDSWQGPEASHQDFIFSNTAVEIKSLSGRERSTVRISSEDQLEGVNDNLFLKIYRLIDMPDSDKALSLNDLVKQMEGNLQEADAIESFSEKLAKAGYVELRAYDTPKFLVAEEKPYCVEAAFPRLIRSELPGGILKVDYEIKLETIERFKCDNQEIWGK
ncbi:MAG: hypothetical protein COA96_13750 [SAR86 cluster bacterium]|uniref:PD-(D/E)XK motif protein n=1 Tax=SAR86 cluster bacterium TaxID=2030880 RepID=A0A2A5AV40_9GAMM|nr:MAG: hypothetical protein COA96_13750 [SAR86 cluster bacterium]